jgi:hypothetical protein
MSEATAAGSNSYYMEPTEREKWATIIIAAVQGRIDDVDILLRALNDFDKAALQTGIYCLETSLAEGN